MHFLVLLTYSDEHANLTYVGSKFKKPTINLNQISATKTGQLYSHGT